MQPCAAGCACTFTPYIDAHVHVRVHVHVLLQAWADSGGEDAGVHCAAPCTHEPPPAPRHDGGGHLPHAAAPQHRGHLCECRISGEEQICFGTLGVHAAYWCCVQATCEGVWMSRLFCAWHAGFCWTFWEPPCHCPSMGHACASGTCPHVLWCVVCGVWAQHHIASANQGSPGLV